jgi:ribosome maturation factor RimP
VGACGRSASDIFRSNLEKWASVARFFFFGVYSVIAGQKQAIEEKARAACEPLVRGEGMELVDVEFLHEREGWILRLLIDKPGGIGIEDCSAITHILNPVLDVEDFIPHEYHLEVSSPGLNRPLTKPAHFAQAEGKKVKVKTYGPIGEPPRKNFSGVLRSSDPEAVTVEVEGAGAFRIPFKDIAKAHLEYEF